MTWKAVSDKDMVETRYNYYFIHNVFGNFTKDTLDYFSDYLYPRFSGWKIIGTYNKSVEYLNKQLQYHRETDQPMLPALILDPSGDFNLDENYGKMLYRFPNLAPGFLKYLYEPIYQDSNILVTVGFSRLVGEFNFIGIMSSFYEYFDMRTYLNLIFGGTDRFIYPKWFNSFIILPKEIYDFQYQNEYTGEDYKINIPGVVNKLIKTTNTNEFVYPCKILPRFKITNISDASTRLGGVSDLPEWKLQWTVGYEIEVPSFIVLEQNYLANSVKINIGYESCYTENDVYVASNIQSFDVNLNHGINDSTSSSEITYPPDVSISNKKERVMKNRYFHKVTLLEEQETVEVIINLPEIVLDQNLLLLNGKYGYFSYGDHYYLSEDGTFIGIKKNNVSLKENDMLEVYIYEYK